MRFAFRERTSPPRQSFCSGGCCTAACRVQSQSNWPLFVRTGRRSPQRRAGSIFSSSVSATPGYSWGTAPRFGKMEKLQSTGLRPATFLPPSGTFGADHFAQGRFSPRNRGLAFNHAQQFTERLGGFDEDDVVEQAEHVERGCWRRRGGRCRLRRPARRKC